MNFDAGLMFTKALSVLTVVGNVLTLEILLASFFAKPFYRRTMKWLGEHALPIGLFLSAGATIGSIIYSQVINYPACILCWIQRIFVYPQMFLFAMAWWRKDKNIIPYTLMLSLFGGAVALYNWIKNMLATYHPQISLGCPIVPGLPSCDKVYFVEFGYVTIAMFSLNVFILLSIVLYAAMNKEKFENA